MSDPIYERLDQPEEFGTASWWICALYLARRFWQPPRRSAAKLWIALLISMSGCPSPARTAHSFKRLCIA